MESSATAAEEVELPPLPPKEVQEDKESSGIDSVYAVIQRKASIQVEDVDEDIPPLPPRTYLDDEDDGQCKTKKKQKGGIKDIMTRIRELNMQQPTAGVGAGGVIDPMTSIDVDHGYRLLTRSSSFDLERESLVPNRLGEVNRRPSSQALYAVIKKERTAVKFNEDNTPLFSPRSQSDDTIFRLPYDDINNYSRVTVESSEYESLRYFNKARVPEITASQGLKACSV